MPIDKEPQALVHSQQGSFLIDWLRPADLPKIAALERNFFPEPLSLLSLLRLYLQKNTYYIVIREGKELAAYIGFQLLGPAAHTISMAVARKYRRQGLAVMTQRAANQVALNLGAKWFTGEVRASNTVQLKFLEREGWEQIGISPGFFGNGEDAVVVWNWLK